MHQGVSSCIDLVISSETTVKEGDLGSRLNEGQL